MEQENNTNSEECLELKNIKYKTMLLNGNPLKETKSENDLSNLDKFLEDEKNNNVNEPWCKLNKTIKTKKILEFVEKYKTEKNLDQEEEKSLLAFLAIPCTLPADNVSVDSSTPVAGTVIVVVVRTPFRSAAG